MSDEFKKISKKEMAQLMIEGHTLEFENGSMCHFFEDLEFRGSQSEPWFHVSSVGTTDDIDWRDIGGYGGCRIYKPKVKKWLWVMKCTLGKYWITPEHTDYPKGCSSYVVCKIEESEIEE